LSFFGYILFAGSGLKEDMSTVSDVIAMPFTTESKHLIGQL